MSDLDIPVDGVVDPCQAKPPGAQNVENTVVPAQSVFSPRLPTHADTTTTVLDSDTALRRGSGPLHALLGRQYADQLATTGDAVIDSCAHDLRGSPWPMRWIWM